MADVFEQITSRISKFTVNDGDNLIVRMGVRQSGVKYDCFPVNTSLSVAPVAATAGVYFTNYPAADIDDGVTAQWFEWPAGAVTANEIDYLTGTVTGIKITSSGGQTTAVIAY